MLSGTLRGMRIKPPAAAKSPRFTSNKPNTAVSARDHEVAREDDLEPARDRGAVHRRDDRLGKLPGDEPGEATALRVHLTAAPRRDQLEVGARARRCRRCRSSRRRAPRDRARRRPARASMPWATSPLTAFFASGRSMRRISTPSWRSRAMVMPRSLVPARTLSAACPRHRPRRARPTRSGAAVATTPVTRRAGSAAPAVVARRPISSAIAPWAMAPMGYSAPISIISTLTARPRSAAGARSWAIGREARQRTHVEEADEEHRDDGQGERRRERVRQKRDREPDEEGHEHVTVPEPCMERAEREPHASPRRRPAR